MTFICLRQWYQIYIYLSDSYGQLSQQTLIFITTLSKSWSSVFHLSMWLVKDWKYNPILLIIAISAIFKLRCLISPLFQAWMQYWSVKIPCCITDSGVHESLNWTCHWILPPLVRICQLSAYTKSQLHTTTEQ